MTILTYNETDKDSRNAFLSSVPSSITLLAGVDFTHPSGSMRVSGFNQFTHFKATFEGTQYIYRVTGFKAINTGVCEFSYELDYLKDYFSKHTLNSIEGALVTRSSDVSLWDKYFNDPSYILDGTAEVASDHIGAFNNRNAGIVMVMESGSASQGFSGTGAILCLMTLDEFKTNQSLIAACENMGFDKSFVTAFVVPDAFTDDGSLNIQNMTGSVRAEIPFFKVDGNLGSVAGTTCLYLTDTNRYAPSYIRYRMNSHVDAKNFSDLFNNSYKLQVPYFGTIDLDVLDKTFIFGSSTPIEEVPIVFDIILDLYTGAVSLRWIYSSGGIDVVGPLLAEGQLAGVSVVSTQGANDQMRFNIQHRAEGVNLALQTVSGLAQTGAGLLVGTAGQTAGGFTSVLSNMNNFISYMDAERAKMMDGLSFLKSSSGKMGLFNNEIRLFEIRPNGALTMEQHGVVNGYICNKLATTISPGPFKYWLSCSTAAFAGPSWYASGVRAELDNGYIRYNIQGG